MRPGVLLGAAALGLLVTETAITKPRLETGPDAEVTFDGLHRVDKSVMDAAWVKPDLDLTGYTKLMVVPAGISFRPVDESGARWWPGRSSQTEFPISEQAQQRIGQEVLTAFTEELGKLERYEIVDEPGPGVLVLRGALLDVVSRVPPADACVGRCDVYLSEVGQATLVLELRDSVTNEILARTADARAAETQGWPISASKVTVWPEVRRLARSWASTVRRRLDDIETVDDLR